MSWPTNVSAGQDIEAAHINDGYLAIRVWGGNVDAAGFNLSNVGALTAATGTFSGAVSAVSLTSGAATVTTALTGALDWTTQVRNSNAAATVTEGILRVVSANDASNNFIINALSAAGSRFAVRSDGLVQVTGSAWNGGHFVLGSYHLWVDSSHRLRISLGAPVSDTDGSTVGSQV